MSEISEGRGRSASARLLAIADTEMYVRNPFRITGLATDAPRRLVRETRQRVLSQLAVDAVPSIADARLPLPEFPSVEEVRGAFDELGNLEHRLVDELFWWWGESDDCDCPIDVHRAHDAAVRTNAMALDCRPGKSKRHDTLWLTSARLWAAVSDREEFWNHLRHRVRLLGDRRLDESTVDGLRAALPQALLAPLSAVVAAADDPTGLLRCFDAWGFDAAVVEDARTGAAAGIFERIAELRAEIDRLLEDKTPNKAATLALDDLVPQATRLEKLLPHQRFRQSASARNGIALSLNNSGVALFESARRPVATRRVADLFTQATALAVAEETKDLIQRNSRATLVDSLLHRPVAPARPIRPRVGGSRQPSHPYTGGGSQREPNPPDPVLGGLLDGQGGARSLIRWSAVISYTVTLVGLVSFIAEGPLWLTAVAAFLGWPVTATAAGKGSLRRLVTLAALSFLLSVVSLILLGTGAMADRTLHISAYLAAIAMFVIVIRLAIRRSNSR